MFQLLGFLLTITSTYGIRTFVNIEINNEVSQYDCIAADFSRNTKIPIADYITVMPITIDDCNNLDIADSVDISGKVLIFNMSECNVNKAAFWSMLESREVEGVLVVPHGVGMIPIPLEASLTQNLNFHVCMMWHTGGSAIINNITNNNATTVEVDFSELIVWDAANTHYDPPHTFVPVDVLEPFEFKWRYIAGQSTFNPQNHASATGNLVIPKFVSQCDITRTMLQRSYDREGLLEQCDVCYEQDHCLTEDSRAEVDGQVVLWDTSSDFFSLCFVYFYQLAYIAQRYGAVGSVVGVPHWSDLQLGPYTIPFEMKIAIFSMVSFYVGSFSQGVQDNTRVSMRLPAIVDGTAIAYDVSEPDIKDIGDTVITVKHNASFNYTIIVGQATFNPRTLNETSARGVVARVHPACGHEDTRECDICYEALHNHTALSNDEEMEGHIVVINQHDFFCVHTWAEVMSAINRTGAVGIIINNTLPLRWTLVDRDSGLTHHEDAELDWGLAMFNVRSVDGDRLVQSIDNNDTIILPSIVNGVGTTTPPDPSQDDELPLAQLYISADDAHGRSVLGDAYSDYQLAGQALFNPPNSEKVTAKLALPVLVGACNAAESCHGCEQLDTPMMYMGVKPTTPRILLIDEEMTRCIRPLVNFVKFAEAMDAVGVIFINTDEKIYTMEPHETGYDLSIPAFNVPKSLGAKLKEVLSVTYWSGRNVHDITIQLPEVEAYTPSDDNDLEEKEVTPGLNPEVVDVVVGAPRIEKPELLVFITTTITLPRVLTRNEVVNVERQFCDLCVSFYAIRISNIKCMVSVVSDGNGRRLLSNSNLEMRKMSDVSELSGLGGVIQRRNNRRLEDEPVTELEYGFKATVTVYGEEEQLALEDLVDEKQEEFVGKISNLETVKIANDGEELDVADIEKVNTGKVVEREVKVVETNDVTEGLTGGQIAACVISALILSCCLTAMIARWFRNRRKTISYDRFDHSVTIDCQTDFDDFEDINMMEMNEHSVASMQRTDGDEFPALRSGLADAFESATEETSLNSPPPPPFDDDPPSRKEGAPSGMATGSDFNFASTQKGKVIEPSKNVSSLPPLDVWTRPTSAGLKRQVTKQRTQPMSGLPPLKKSNLL